MKQVVFHGGYWAAGPDPAEVTAVLMRNNRVAMKLLKKDEKVKKKPAR